FQVLPSMLHITSRLRYSPLRPLTFPFLLFFFTDTPTTEIYTLSLHDALPICLRARGRVEGVAQRARERVSRTQGGGAVARERERSEEHTSELQSRSDLVCRLLLEKKKKKKKEVCQQRNIIES